MSSPNPRRGEERQQVPRIVRERRQEETINFWDTQARRDVLTIFTKRRALIGILRRHQPKIYRRWQGKTRAERETILLDPALGYPNMPTQSRPDRHWYNKFNRWHEAEIKAQILALDEKVWLLPLINLEDLAGDFRKMMVLLNARERYGVSDFLNSEWRLQTLGISTQRLDRQKDLLPNHVMIMTEENWGLIVTRGSQLSLNTDPSNRWSVGLGLLILRAQKFLYTFLEAFCTSLLRDVPDGQLLSNRYPVVEPILLPPPVDAQGVTAGAVEIAERPYGLNASPNLEVILELVSGRLAGIRDDIASLRNDPDYFRETLHEYDQHVSERVRYRDGGLKQGVDDHVYEEEGENGKDLRILGVAGSLHDMVYSTFEKYELFSVLESRCKMAVQDLNPDSITALYLRLSMSLNRMLTAAASIARGPRTRHMYEKDRNGDRIFRKTGLAGNPSPAVGEFMDLVDDCATQCASKAWDPRAMFFWHGRIETANRLASQEEVKGYLTPFNYQGLGDLALVSQCLQYIEFSNPWGRVVNNTIRGLTDRGVVNIDDLEKPLRVLSDFCARYQDFDREPTKTALIRFLQPSYSYPIHAPDRTEDDVNTLQEVEKDLDFIWMTISNDALRNSDSLAFVEAQYFMRVTWSTLPANCRTVSLDKEKALKLEASRRAQQDARRVARKAEEDALKAARKAQIDARLAAEKAIREKQQKELEEKAISELGRLNLRRKPATDPTPPATDPRSGLTLLIPNLHRPGPDNAATTGRLIARQNLPKAKVKTRGISSAASAASEAEDEGARTPPPPPPKPVYRVDERTYRVFATMLFSTDPNMRGTEVKWTDFVYAMKQMGFEVNERVHGSACLFKPPPAGPDDAAAQQNRRLDRHSDYQPQSLIEFHKPHPDAKWDWRRARQNGSRLARRYDWDMERIILRDD